MSNLWTREQDLTLLAARQKARAAVMPKIDSAEAAAAAQSVSVPLAKVIEAYQDMAGVVLTRDQARNRLRRLDAAAEAQDSAKPTPISDLPFDDIAVPEGEYVGFHIAFFDIETTDLKAMMGRILCWSIADSWGNITHRTIYDFPQGSVIDDRGVTVALRQELEKYDILIGWNSKMFDAPMLNARLMRWGERPMRFDMMHIDPMWRARAGTAGIRIGSSKLVNVDRYFNRDGSGLHKTEIEWDTWALAQAGDRKAMEYLVEHCDHDVLVLRSVFNHMKPLIRNIHR